MSNFLAREPGQPFDAYLEATLQNLLQGLWQHGSTPDQARVNTNVTQRSDAEIELLARRAAELGLIRLQLVDDQVPARPGTMPSSLLGPLDASSMAEARAARILGEG